MTVMPLVPETKMADVGKLISLRNLLARKTTWLVLITTSSTSILSRVFGAYCMTRIVYKYSHLPTLILFHIFSYRVNSLFPLWLPERTLSLTLSISTNRVNTLFLLFTFDFQHSTNTKMYTPCNHSLSCYTFLVRLFPASNAEISSNHRMKQTVVILSQHALDTFVQYSFFVVLVLVTHTHTEIFNEQYSNAFNSLSIRERLSDRGLF